MKIKLLKAYKPADAADELPAGSVLDMADDAAKELIKSETACEYTDATAADEQTKAVKALQDQLVTQKTELATKQAEIDAAKAAELATKKGDNTMSTQIIVPKAFKDMNRDEQREVLAQDPNLIGKAMQHLFLKDAEFASSSMGQRLAQKAAAGMSELTAADGGDLVVTAISRIMGLVFAESEFLNRVTKLTLPDQTNSMQVVYEASDWWNSSAAPLGVVASDGSALTPTKLQFAATTVYPKTPAILGVVTAELMEDVAGLSSEVTRVMVMKLAKIVEGLCFTGNGGNGSDGFVGILATSGSGQVSRQTISSLSGPTLAELQGFIAQVVPAWRKNSKWYMSNAMWQTLRGSTALVFAGNIGLQVIDLINNKLLGYDVEIIEALPASTPIVFGDPSQYTLVQGRNGQIMLFSRELYFASNQLAFRLTHRVGGAIAASKYTLADSSTVAPFCKYSIANS